MKDNNPTYYLSDDDEQNLRDLLKQFREAELEKPKSVEVETENREVLLLIGGQIERIELSPDKICRLGRFEDSTDYQIDLTPHGAMRCGVSRRHASLLMKGEKIYIVDNNSSNGTYVEGRRVHDKPMRLTNGCHIMLGILQIQVMFR